MNLNSLLGAQWVAAFVLFMLAGGRIVSGLIDPLRNKPTAFSEFLSNFAVRYRLATALAVMTTAALFLDIARLRYHWHILWMDPNATTWNEFALRSVWLLCVFWWICEQYVPVMASLYRDVRRTVRNGRITP